MMVGFIYQTYSSTVYKKPSMRENCHDLRRKWLFVVKLSLYHFYRLIFPNDKAIICRKNPLLSENYMNHKIFPCGHYAVYSLSIPIWIASVSACCTTYLRRRDVLTKLGSYNSSIHICLEDVYSIGQQNCFTHDPQRNQAMMYQ